MGARSRALTDRGAAIPSNLIEEWAAAATAQASVEPMEAPHGYYAEVAETPGAWGHGETEDEALSVLHSVLVGWASLKLADVDADIPVMDGVNLYGRCGRGQPKDPATSATPLGVRGAMAWGKPRVHDQGESLQGMDS